MSFSKWERISAYVLYTKLHGDGRMQGLFDAHLERTPRLEHCFGIIDSQREQDINNPYMLYLLAKRTMREDLPDKELDRQRFIRWTQRAKPETVNRALVGLAESLCWENAVNIKGVYQTLFKDGHADNPWTRENCNKPGYAVIPYFCATDPDFLEVAPAHHQDQKDFTKITENFMKSNLPDDDADNPTLQRQNLISVIRNQWYILHPEYQNLHQKNGR